MRTHSTDPTRLLPHESRLLYILAGVQFSHIVDFMIMMPLGPMLARDMGIATHEFGLLVSSYTFAAAISGLLCALFIDRFNRKPFLLTLYILFALATLACAFAPSYGTLLLARALAGAFGGVLGAIVNTVVADHVPPQRRGQAMGILSSSFAASTVAGVPASLWLANHVDALAWRAPFVAVTIMSALFGIAFWRLTPEGHVPKQVAGNAFKLGVQGIWATLADADQRRALLFAMVLMASSFTIIPYLTIYATKNVGFPETMLPLMYLIGGLCTLVTARLIGRWTDRAGKLHVYRILAVLAMIPMVGVTHLGLVPTWVYIVFSSAFFVLVSGRWIPAQALIAGSALPATRGTYMSLLACAVQLSMGVGSFVSGHMIHMDTQGNIVGFEYVGYLSAVATLTGVWLSSRLLQRS